MKTDRVFIAIVVALVSLGVLIFASASLGILARSESKFLNIVASQFLLGLFGGLFAFLVFSKIPYRVWKRYALGLFVFSLLLAALVFVPGIGFEHGGARRWIEVGSFSFQPSEFLKFGLIVYLAAWLSWAKDRVGRMRYDLVPLAVLLSLSAAIMLKEPDTGTFIVMATAALATFFVSGAPWKHLFLICVLVILGLAVMVAVKPYLKDRLVTFFHPATDPQGTSYQIRQSLIAIGSGELFGRGLGQSVQKFEFLPEPVGDSVFAVIGEELGFVGGAATVFLFLLFGLRGFKIGSRAPDEFGRNLAVGIISLILAQSFINMASLVGLFPLTGIPLSFVSHGGTALFFALAEVGIVVNISKYAKG